jgi:hypothetical protein
MPRATKCLFGEKEIGIEEALGLRGHSIKRRKSNQSAFRCVHCGEPVRAHKQSDHALAHFEHFKRNGSCPLSDRRE